MVRYLIGFDGENSKKRYMNPSFHLNYDEPIQFLFLCKLHNYTINELFINAYFNYLIDTIEQLDAIKDKDINLKHVLKIKKTLLLLFYIYTKNV